MRNIHVMYTDSSRYGLFRLRRPRPAQHAILASLWLVLALLAATPGRAATPSKPVALKPVTAADMCKRLAARLPGVSAETCLNSELVPTGTNSIRGNPILARYIPASSKSKPAVPLRILLIGGIHGDELTASAIVFRWMQLMQTPQAQDFTWHVVPILNPDGLLATHPQRTNANGVDLNRNFPTPGWKQEAPRYWKENTGNDPRRYPGKGPLSEPESRWLNDEMARFNPNVVISVHAPFGVLDFDGPAKKVPQRFGRLTLTPVGIYPGSLGNYSGVHKNVPVITIELPNAQDMPTDAESERIWQDMLAWIQRNVSKSVAPVQRTADSGAPPGKP